MDSDWNIGQFFHGRVGLGATLSRHMSAHPVTYCVSFCSVVCEMGIKVTPLWAAAGLAGS